jgi:hypothetical protein
VTTPCSTCTYTTTLSDAHDATYHSPLFTFSGSFAPTFHSCTLGRPTAPFESYQALFLT